MANDREKVSRSGVERIAAERKRQIEVEKWSATHDDEHTEGELALAAVCYATPILLYRMENYANRIDFVDPWPEDLGSGWDKRPHPDRGNVVGPNNALSTENRIRQMEKAGALIAAEIDRLLRVRQQEENNDG